MIILSTPDLNLKKTQLILDMFKKMRHMTLLRHVTYISTISFLIHFIENNINQMIINIFDSKTSIYLALGFLIVNKTEYNLIV